MRQAQRGVDWGLLLVIGFSLLLAWPFITQPTLSHSNASENIVYAASNFATAFKEGRLYPRWSPYVLGGYGAPIPHYYPPGAAYFAAVIQVLLTDDTVSAVRFAYTLALCLAGIAVYRLVMRREGAAAGVLAAFLYLYSPYVGLVAPHVLGDLPGTLALALVPLLLWQLDRLFQGNHPGDVLLLALAAAALCLTDTRGLIAGLGLGMMLAATQPGTNRRLYGLAAAGVALGMGAAACFWLPAALEQSAVQWRPPFIPSSYQLTLAGLFTPAHQLDLNDLAPVPQFTLGLPALLFGGLGAAALVRERRLRGFAATFLAAAVGLTALALILIPAEAALLGTITLCLAVVGSAALHWRDALAERWRRLVLPIALIATWVLAAPVWLATIITEPFLGTDAAAQIQYELAGCGLPVLPPDLPVPATIPANLPPNRTLIEGYLSGTMSRLNVTQTADDLRVGILTQNTHSSRFQVSATRTLTMDMLLAYFPGWQASLDGRPMPLFAGDTDGLTRVTISPVRGGLLALELNSTPARTGAWMITWSAIGIALIVTWGRFRRAKPTYEDVRLLSPAEARLLALVFVCLVLLTLLAALPGAPVPLRQSPGYALKTAASLQSRTNASLSLLAYRLDTAQFQPGKSFDVTLYWQAQEPLTENYRTLLYLLDTRTGARWNQQDYRHPGGHPTRCWNTNRYVSDVYHLPLVPAMPPGEYQVAVEVYACKPECLPQNRVTFFDATGRNLGPVLYLPTTLTVQN